MLRATAGTVPPAPPIAWRLRRLLGFAFLGGLILNLMPCVFPVLAMKVVGLAGAPGGEGALAGGRLHRRRAGGIRRPGCGAAGGARRGHGGRLGVPVPVAGVRRRHGMAAVRCRAEPVRRVRGRHRAGTAPGTAWRARPGNSAASSPGCLPWWWRRPAPRRSWASPSPPALPRRRR